MTKLYNEKGQQNAVTIFNPENPEYIINVDVGDPRFSADGIINTLETLLEDNDIKQVCIMITHEHEDHVGALEEVIALYEAYGIEITVITSENYKIEPAIDRILENIYRNRIENELEIENKREQVKDIAEERINDIAQKHNLDLSIYWEKDRRSNIKKQYLSELSDEENLELISYGLAIGEINKDRALKIFDETKNEKYSLKTNNFWKFHYDNILNKTLGLNKEIKEVRIEQIPSQDTCNSLYIKDFGPYKLFCVDFNYWELDETDRSRYYSMVYSTDVKYKEFGGWRDDLNRTCATFYVENKNDDFSYMTLGDLCQEEEFFIVKAFENFRNVGLIDKNCWRNMLMQCSHHGSRFSISKELYENFKPVAVLISALKAVHQHPDDLTLRTLDNLEISYLESEFFGRTKVVVEKGDINFYFENLNKKLEKELKKNTRINEFSKKQIETIDLVLEEGINYENLKVNASEIKNIKNELSSPRPNISNIINNLVVIKDNEYFQEKNRYER